ncbi:MAG: DUF4082 domain-containing protein [Rhodospirillales bacterium]
MRSGRLLLGSVLGAFAAFVLSLPVVAVAAVPEPAGWYAGDPHVHRSCGGSPEAVTSLRTKMSTNNLRVISLLADCGNGEVQNATTDLPLVTGLDASQTNATRMLHWDTEWHWDATFYDPSVQHHALGGHLVLLGLSNAHQIWEEYTYPIFLWAHGQSPRPVAGFAHMQYLDDGIPGELNCCIPIEYPVEVALGAADFVSEDVAGGNSAMNAYYRLLNAGFRPGFAGGTDYPCGVSQLGSVLTYVQVDGEFTYRKWIEGIKNGRTVVSRNGHKEFLDLKVNGSAGPGDELAYGAGGATKVPVTVKWTASQKITGGAIELVQNGVVLKRQPGTVTATAPLTLSTTVDVSKSGWLTARRVDAAGEHRLQTGAVFININNQPVRVSADDANFYVKWMNTLLARTTPGGAWDLFETAAARDAARARYSAAKTVYQNVCVEAGGTVCDGSSGGGGTPVEGTLFGTTTPGTITENDAAAVELGMKFQAAVAGNITALRFYKGPSNTGTHVGHLWSASGQLLATATFSNETQSGWQQVNLTTPVPIAANTTYVVSYHTNVGYYSADNGYFIDDVVTGSLTAPADTPTSGNGVYHYGTSTTTFPTDTWGASNYWVDVVFQ